MKVLVKSQQVNVALWLHPIANTKSSVTSFGISDQVYAVSKVVVKLLQFVTFL